jgi:hypothetical protein
MRCLGTSSALMQQAFVTCVRAAKGVGMFFNRLEPELGELRRKPHTHEVGGGPCSPNFRNAQTMRSSSGDVDC